MPIELAATPTVPEPTAPGRPTPAPGPRRPAHTNVPPRQRFDVLLRDVDGTELALTGGRRIGIRLRRGLQGIDMPPVVVSSSPIADRHGDVLTGLRYGARDISGSVFIRGRSYLHQREQTQQLLHLFAPDRGHVELLVAQPDGTVRGATGLYVGGAEGSYTETEWGIEWRIVPFTIRCFDPFFYGLTPVERTYQIGATTKPWLENGEAFFPARLRASNIIAGEDPVIIDNPGDAPASYGRWTLRGPAGSPGGTLATFENVTTGQSFTLTGALDPGETITVDTRRPTTVTSGTGGNEWDRLASGYQLWPFAPGRNQVRLLVPNATGDSSVSLWLPPTYRTA